VPRFCSVFPDAWSKIEKSWGSRGRFAGYNRHLREIAERFPQVVVHENVWITTRPRTSASAHMFLKAVALIEREAQGDGAESLPYLDRLSTKAAGEMRLAFFASAKDISEWNVHREIAERIGIDYSAVEEKIRSSEAVAQLAADYDLSQKNGVEGSPTILMNDGRQKLFGNVGYRLLQANVQELLRHPAANEASWC
ncbi:MAG: DsbA family oxidoreductase, partial [Methyloceanibacter sp.]|uniref:DsbA family oxidoreductase n=1 Tax=Methyloceanibacter sp. TaxID=1965321 RepID=UPI003EE39803